MKTRQPASLVTASAVCLLAAVMLATSCTDDSDGLDPHVGGSGAVGGGGASAGGGGVGGAGAGSLGGSGGEGVGGEGAGEPSLGPHYYVAPSGDDANDGSAAHPWQTLVHAAAEVTAGVLHVGAGVYLEHVVFRHSGTADNYLFVQGEPGAIIDGSSESEDVYTSGASYDTGQLMAEDVSYFVFDGITVRDSKRHGIMVDGDGHHVRVRNCTTEHTRGSGIYIYGEWPFTGYHLDDVIVEQNEVHWPQEGRWDGHNVWQEDITLSGGVENFIVRHNYVNAYDSTSYSGGPLGIDVKAGVRHGVIHHNLVENVPSSGIYVDAYEAEALDIEIYQNISRHVSAFGIIIGAEAGGRLDNIKIYNNVVHDTGWAGLNCDDYNGSGNPPQPKTGIDFFNNTVYRTGIRQASDGTYWGPGVNTGTTYNGRIYNNIIVQARTGLSVDAHAGVTVTNHCLHDNQYDGDVGTAAVLADPLFTDAATGDFHLGALSPCVDAGTSQGAPASDFDGTTRPLGAGFDIGAFEHIP